MELLDSTEKLVEAQSQIAKLQTNVDNIMKEKVQRHVWLFSTDFLGCWGNGNIFTHVFVCLLDFLSSFSSQA